MCFEREFASPNDNFCAHSQLLSLYLNHWMFFIQFFVRLLLITEVCRFMSFQSGDDPSWKCVWQSSGWNVSYVSSANSIFKPFSKCVNCLHSMLQGGRWSAKCLVSPSANTSAWSQLPSKKWVVQGTFIYRGLFVLTRPSCLPNRHLSTIQSIYVGVLGTISGDLKFWVTVVTLGKRNSVFRVICLLGGSCWYFPMAS